MTETDERRRVIELGERASGMAPTLAPARRDEGFSYIEILVSIVLVGSVVIATLISLRATIVANEVGDDRSRLMVWMQSGVEAVQRHPFEPCSSGVLAVESAYQSALAAVAPPDGFSGGSLTVDDVRFLSVDPSTMVERWGTDCDPNRRAELLTLQALTPDGSRSITLEVVVNG